MQDVVKKILKTICYYVFLVSAITIFVSFPFLNDGHAVDTLSTEKDSKTSQENSKPKTKQRALRYCSSCGALAKLKRCGGCLDIRYCSEKCQKKDWSRHKLDCLSLTQTELSSASEADSNNSELTKTSDLNDKTPEKRKTHRYCGSCGALAWQKCDRCLKIRYCNEECQRKDWPKHKLDCRRLARNEESAVSLSDERSSSNPVETMTLLEAMRKGDYTSVLRLIDGAEGNLYFISNDLSFLELLYVNYLNSRRLGNPDSDAIERLETYLFDKDGEPVDHPIIMGLSSLAEQAGDQEFSAILEKYKVLAVLRQNLVTGLSAYYEDRNCNSRTSDRNSGILASPEQSSRQHVAFVINESKGEEGDAGSEKTVNESPAERRCTFCNGLTSKILLCNYCGRVQYCSKSCQDKHWKKHKRGCKKEIKK